MHARNFRSALIMICILAAAAQLSAAPSAPAPAQMPSSLPAKSSQVWKQEPEDPGPWTREPFKKIEDPKNSAKQPGSSGFASEPAVQGIMKIDQHYYAIINGRTVKSGDRVDEWTVGKISRHRVTFRREKEQQTIDIYQGRIHRGTK